MWLRGCWVPLPPVPRGKRSCVKRAACLERDQPSACPFANPSHLPFPPWLVLDSASTFDPFAKPPVSTETKEGLECAQALPSGKPSSPVGKQESGNVQLWGRRGPPRAGLCLLPLRETTHSPYQ